MAKKYDLIVYGATGFTGRLVADYLQAQYGNGKNFSWAIAGRSQAKLEQVRDSMGLPDETPLVIADATEVESLRAMVKSTRVIITTVGPYQLYGDKLVEVCAQEGTDYVDLCGEAVWMRRMIDAHEETAKASGARIVFSCGFDSIPSDLGVLYLQNLAKEQTGAVCRSIQCRVQSMKGTFSGGTAASLKASLKAAKNDPEYYRLAVDPYACVPGFEGVEQPNGNRVYYDQALDSWVAPFIMAAINTRNVHRSNFLLGHRYGKDFTYDEMILTGPGEKGEVIANSIANDRSMAGPDAPKPGEGPTKAERDAGSYDILYIGTTADDQQVTVRVMGDRDPGYGSTSKMLSESAICLISDATDTAGGIWTTAPALGEKLILRLQKNAGLTFTQV